MENRVGGPSRLPVTFDAPIMCTGEPGNNPVRLSSGQVEDLSVDGNRLSVQISQVPEGQRLTVSFPGITGTDGTPVGDGLCLGVLNGDVTGDGVVNARDLDAAREAISADRSAPDLRFDVNLNGRLNSFDITAIRARFGRTISPGCP
jgi:hypothetical protein